MANSSGAMSGPDAATDRLSGGGRGGGGRRAGRGRKARQVAPRARCHPSGARPRSPGRPRGGPVARAGRPPAGRRRGRPRPLAAQRRPPPPGAPGRPGPAPRRRARGGSGRPGRRAGSPPDRSHGPGAVNPAQGRLARARSRLAGASTSRTLRRPGDGQVTQPSATLEATMAQIRGTDVSSLRTYLREKVGPQAERELLGRLPDALRTLYLETSPVTWNPVEAQAELYEAAASFLFPEVSEPVVELHRVLARMSYSGVYRL